MKLSDAMEFDHVIRIDDKGNIGEATDVYAPSLFEDELDDESWELMNGYSGQSGYSGPIMHNSELIGGSLERDILARPGLYVAIVSCYEDDYAEGWAIAYREENN